MATSFGCALQEAAANGAIGPEVETPRAVAVDKKASMQNEQICAIDRWPKVAIKSGVFRDIAIKSGVFRDIAIEISHFSHLFHSARKLENTRSIFGVVC